MEFRNSGWLLVVAGLAFAPLAHGQTTKSKPAGNKKPSVSADKKFNPRDIGGPWLGDARHRGFEGIGSFDQKVPEPPLTEWGKKNLLYKAIAHDSLDGTHVPGWNTPGKLCSDLHQPCFLTDQNGVPANVAEGEYPGRDCEPLSSPAVYDYPRNGAMELVFTPEGDRVFQMFDYHREWRTFWMNGKHPEEVEPTYEGHSIAHWEGNTLVVDTVGYNGKTMITQNVGHKKSDAFRLVERIRLLDKDHLTIEMTLYDTKAWGDKSWPGFSRFYHRVPKEDFQEFICSLREYQDYDNVVTDPALKTDAPGGNKPANLLDQQGSRPPESPE